MVKRVKPGAWARFGILLFAFVVLGLAIPTALAQDGEYGATQEEVLIEVNEVGDAHVTDTITYDEAWFEEYGAVFDENPFLLSRRYREDSDVGEVENFEADIDTGDSTVTLTFDAPGLVYNMGDRWELYGYADYELSDLDDDKVVLEASWEGVNSEYTLWFDMYLDETVVIDLPEGAANADFDPEDGAVSYELAYVPGAGTGKKGGLLAENKPVFGAVFGAVMALSLLLFIFAMTSKPREAPAAAPGERGAPMFCRKCGHPRGSPDERFCRKCGAPHTE